MGSGKRNSRNANGLQKMVKSFWLIILIGSFSLNCTNKTITSSSRVFDIRNEMQNGFGSITGRVADAETGVPLPGANIYVKGSTIGAASDYYGIYKISNVTPGAYKLTCAFIGYKSFDKELLVEGNKTIIIDFNLALDRVDSSKYAPF